MILYARNRAGAELILDALTLPVGGTVVTDVEVDALAALAQRRVDNWMRARIGAWREVHRRHSDAAAPGIDAWKEIRRGR